MKIMEVIIHKAPMKHLLKCVVYANHISGALKVINAEYPYPLFEEKDVISHKYLTQKQKEEALKEYKESEIKIK